MCAGAGHSAEDERIGLDARPEELDLEAPVADGGALATSEMSIRRKGFFDLTRCLPLKRPAGARPPAEK